MVEGVRGFEAGGWDAEVPTDAWTFVSGDAVGPVAAREASFPVEEMLPRVATETRSFADSKVSKIGRREVLGVADALHARVQETNRSRAEHLLDGE